MTFSRSLIALLLLTVGSFAVAATTANDDDKLSQQIQQLKENVLNINSELSILEQELLYPSSETAFFLSVDVGTPIRLVDVNTTLDGQHVAYHFYTRQEFEALTQGGIQRLYSGNIASGSHSLEVTVTGYNPQGHDYQKTFNFSFVKGPGRKFIELHAKDDLNTMTPQIEMREWDKWSAFQAHC